jgi:uncharacterized protein YbaR (Trm112 family)
MDSDLHAPLVCPRARAPLVNDARHQELVARVAALGYPLRDSVSAILADEALTVASASLADR